MLKGFGENYTWVYLRSVQLPSCLWCEFDIARNNKWGLGVSAVSAIGPAWWVGMTDLVLFWRLCIVVGLVLDSVHRGVIGYCWSERRILFEVTFKVDFLAATISEWDGLFYFYCKFTSSTTMYGGKMGLVWFWWAPCVRGCISSAKQAAGTPDSSSDIHSPQQFFYTLTPSLLQPNTYLHSQYHSSQDRVISEANWLLK